VSLFIDLFSCVLSYSSEGIISSYNEGNYFSGKERLRRVDNSARSNWDELRGKATSEKTQLCSAEKMLVELIVNTKYPDQMQFYIATLPSKIGSQSLMYLKNTEKTTPSVKVTPGKVFRECLDQKKTYLLVIANPTGEGFQGGASLELKIDGKAENVASQLQFRISKYIRTHIFGAPRDCDVGDLFSLFIRTDESPEQTTWLLWTEYYKFPEEGLIKYTKPNALTIWEKCTQEAKVVQIYDLNGFSSGSLGFFAVYFGGSLKKQEVEFSPRKNNFQHFGA